MEDLQPVFLLCQQGPQHHNSALFLEHAPGSLPALGEHKFSQSLEGQNVQPGIPR
jgi:hypothetical protein